MIAAVLKIFQIIGHLSCRNVARCGESASGRRGAWVGRALPCAPPAANGRVWVHRNGAHGVARLTGAPASGSAAALRCFQNYPARPADGMPGASVRDLLVQNN